MPQSLVGRVAKSLAARVFVLFLVIYTVTAPGGYECADAVERYATAKSWLAGEGGALRAQEPGSTAEDGSVAPDGRLFSFYGPFQSVLMLPTLIAAKALAPRSTDTVAKLLFGIVTIPLVSALSMAILCQALLAMGYSRRVSFWTTLLIGLATPMWHYSRSGQEENIVGLAFSIYLLGVAWLFAERYSGFVLVALTAGIVVATRWSYMLALASILAPVALVLWRRRKDARKWGPSLAAAVGVGAAVSAAVLGYNYARFSRPFETGYGVYFRQHHLRFFDWSDAPAHIAALLVSPYRGFLWFCPSIVILLGFRRARRSEIVQWLWPFTVAACVINLLLISGFAAWTAGFAWGPRYLVAPTVLLAPMFAAVFASGGRWVGVAVASFIVQFCSVVLPSASENLVQWMKETAVPGSCSPWSCDCTAVCLRVPWVLRALSNTALSRPLPILDPYASLHADPASALASSDYNSVYWWPVRAAYRAHALSPSLALALCLTALAMAAYAVRLIDRECAATEAAADR